jgi:hypothetical protein
MRRSDPHRPQAIKSEINRRAHKAGVRHGNEFKARLNGRTSELAANGARAPDPRAFLTTFEKETPRLHNHHTTHSTPLKPGSIASAPIRPRSRFVAINPAAVRRLRNQARERRFKDHDGRC